MKVLSNIVGHKPCSIEKSSFLSQLKNFPSCIPHKLSPLSSLILFFSFIYLLLSFQTSCASVMLLNGCNCASICSNIIKVMQNLTIFMRILLTLFLSQNIFTFALSYKIKFQASLVANCLFNCTNTQA